MNKIYIPKLKKELVPENYKLLEGVDSIYELEFALSEIRNLNKEELIRRSAYLGFIDGKETMHRKLCIGLDLSNISSSTRLKAFFQKFRFKTGYATHGLFPYKGKFHPQLIKGLMNIMNLKNEDIILDPFTGSGTTNIEAAIIGLKSIGIDANPFCVFMTKTKSDALKIDRKDLDEIKNSDNIFDYFAKSSIVQVNLKENMPFEMLEKYFSNNPIIKNFFKLCYLDALAYSKRRKNKTPKDLFPKVYERYMTVLNNFISVRDENNIQLGPVYVAEGDARNLSKLKSEDIKEIGENEIDGIITSPPYSFAINYLEEDRLQLEYLGYDIEELRKNMIGLRGEKFIDKVEIYFKDLDASFAEMHRVLKPDKYASVIIGYNTVQIQRELNELGINLENKVVDIAEKNKLSLEKRIIRPIEGARNIMQTEDIFIFENE